MAKRKCFEGEFKVGDIIDGKRVTGLGKKWNEKYAGKEHFQGQLWEECDNCNLEEPIYMPHHICETCINRRYGKSTSMQYAYLED